MFITVSEFINFVTSNLHWILFVGVALWVVFLPQINNLINHRTKKHHYYTD